MLKLQWGSHTVSTVGASSMLLNYANTCPTWPAIPSLPDIFLISVVSVKVSERRTIALVTTKQNRAEHWGHGSCWLHVDMVREQEIRLAFDIGADKRTNQPISHWWQPVHCSCLDVISNSKYARPPLSSACYTLEISVNIAVAVWGRPKLVYELHGEACDATWKKFFSCHKSNRTIEKWIRHAVFAVMFAILNVTECLLLILLLLSTIHYRLTAAK